MFRRFIEFCKRLFRSKGFRRGLRITLLVFLAYYLYNGILYIRAARSIGIPFWTAVSWLFKTPLLMGTPAWPSASIALGVIIGLIWYFHRKKQNEPQEELEEKADETPAPPQEEEIIETTHYRFH